MCTRCSTLLSLSLVAALAICVAGVSPVPGQTNGQTRPRSFVSSQERSVGGSDEANLPVGSPEARAEAKQLYKAGVDYGIAGFFPQAAELFRRALRLDPQYADAYRSLGRAYSDMKEWDKAVQSLEQALALNPKDKEARKRLNHAQLMLATDTKKPEPQQPGGASMPTISATKVSANEMSLTKVYRVGPGDVLDVSLGRTQSAESPAFTVSASGFLSHPNLAEPLLVAGLTVEEISAQLESAAKQRGSTGIGTVSVGVRDYVSHTILVSGLVKDPGTKILRREAIPLSVVVADAQPLPEAGKATIVRSESNEMFTIDLAETADMNLLVHSGDVITLQANPPQFFYVAGEVKEPGEKPFRRGLTLTQAIISAGGLSGNPGEARLARDDGKGFLIVTRYKLKDIEAGKLKDPLIQPGDRITVID
jgi:protein involved in polysaccharide export with SLBB domain